MNRIRKITAILPLLLVSMAVLAQSKADRIYKDNWSNVTWSGSAFIFNSIDTETHHVLSFTLGKDKASAIAKLEKMLEWYEEAEMKDHVTFREGSTQITFYKASELKMIISDGDVDFCKSEYSKRLEGFTFVLGEAEIDKRAEAHHYSLLQKRALTKSAASIAALKDPKFGM